MEIVEPYENEKRKKCCTRRWMQYAATFAATLSMFSSGMHFVWTSPSLPKLYAKDSSIPTSIAEGSWLASISMIADFPGAIVGAFTADYFGRKFAVLATAVPYLVAWILIAFATNIPTILVAKFIVGIADGSTYTILPMYIGEIAEDDIRGRLGNSVTAMMDFGALFIYCVGPWVSIKKMALIATIFPIILIVMFIWMPETPYYLLMKGKKKDAEISLAKLRGLPSVSEEFEEMSAIVSEQMAQTGKWRELFLTRSNFKALCILLGLKTVQQWSGVSAFLVYSELIFKKAGGSVSQSIAAIIFGSVQFAASLFSTLLVDKVGRRPLLLISTGGCLIPLLTQTVYFYLQYQGSHNLEVVGWIPVTTMIIYIIMYSIGLGAIPLMIPSELFPTNIKAKALCVMDMYLALVAFVTTIFYQSLAESYGSHVPFGIFSAVCFIGIFGIYFGVPETKGRSLEEIQDILKGRYKKVEQKEKIMIEELKDLSLNKKKQNEKATLEELKELASNKE